MKKLNLKQMHQMCSDYAMILGSGIDLLDGIKLLEEQSDESVKDVLRSVIEVFENEMDIVQAFSKVGVFDNYFLTMIAIGNDSGYLDKVFDQLALYYERQANIYQKIKDALTYPMILLITMLIVIAILVTKVLPMFEMVLRNLGVTLSNWAVLLMQFGNIFAIFALVVIVVLFLIIIWYGYKVIVKGENVINVMSRIFFLKQLSNELIASQIAYILSLLISSGFVAEDILDKLSGILDYPTIIIKIEEIKKQMNESLGFEEALIKQNIFKPVYNRMLYIGFKSGKADEVMAKIAVESEKDVDVTINKFLNIIEPSIIAILSIVVGAILLAVMLPLMSIMSSLG